MKLRDYQTESLLFLKDHKRALLRLDTGLGKTPVCWELVKWIEDTCFPKLSPATLVICPAYLIPHWRKEKRKWKVPKYSLVKIVSYEYASTNAEELTLDKFNLVICDEAHYLRNWSSARARQIILKILTKASRVVLATATPVVKSAADLHPLFSIIQPGKWGKFKHFAQRYSNAKKDMYSRTGRMRWMGVRKKYAKELAERSKAFTITFKKADVQKELPKRTIIQIPLEVDAMGFGDENLPGQETKELAAIRRDTGLAKVKDIAEWANDIEQGTQVVIFAWHKAVIRRLARRIDGAIGVDGDIPPSKRARLVEQFQRGKFRVFVASIAACGMGISLTAASIVAFAELPWTYTELKQCSDRVLRTGQKNPVHEYRFIAVDSIDEAILRAIDRTIETAEHTIGHIL